MSDPTATADDKAYRVLARKYRPTDFTGLIGQEAMVRTLANAIAAGRLAHAFLLTGVRGVGKTTTARILARAFNCIGPDGKGGPTAEPCGACEHCLAIAEDRHVDVVEMDAASRTGVGDIRELIESVRYRPVQARYKTYIIDEVHMLSTSAFNALLKTLEEPPAHVKFVFATTEIRKVPVTVLSRCQRFDLRRVDSEILAAHFAKIAAAEDARIAPGALTLIARAADGSVRDGLSLLDQAIGRAEGEIGEAQVREMLGLADRTQLFQLLDHAMRGQPTPALDLVQAMYRAGADPLVLMQDLLDLVHWLTRAKLTPTLADDPTLPEAERSAGKAMAAGLGLPALARAWQMLLKGLSEAQAAPQPLKAVEMALIRLIYLADGPTPGELVKKLEQAAAMGAAVPAPASSATTPSRSSGGAPAQSSGGSQGGARAIAVGEGRGGAQPAPVGETQAELQAQPNPPAALADPQSFEELVALAAEKREAILHAQLLKDVHLVNFEPGRLEFHPGPTAPTNLAARISAALQEWTGRRWIVAISAEPGRETLQQKAEAARQRADLALRAHPLVKAVLEAFPGASLGAVRRLDASPESGNAESDNAESGDLEPGDLTSDDEGTGR